MLFVLIMGNIQAQLPNMQVPINYNGLLKSDNKDPQVKTLLEFEAYLLKTLFLDPIFLESAMSGAALFDDDDDNIMSSSKHTTLHEMMTVVLAKKFAEQDIMGIVKLHKQGRIQ